MSGTNVLRFNVEDAKCPPGSKAIHPEFGWCEVVAAEGFERSVIYETHSPDGESVGQVDAVVNVRDLREIDPRKDFVGQPAGSVSMLFRGAEENA